VQCAVELAVAAAVEAVADRLSGGGGDRCAAGEAGEGGFASDPAAVRPGEHDLRGRGRADAGLIEQLRCQRVRELFDLARELALFVGQVLDAASDRAQRLQRAARLDVTVTCRAYRGQSTQQLRACQRTQLAPQRLRCRDQQVAQPAEPSSFRIHRALASRH
jgi:hypothetical protein